MILVVSWAMMLNIAKLIRDRMIMQNTADNIALSAAMHKARVMNFVGALNYLIGSALALGTKPEFVQFPTYTTNAVAAIIWSDNESGSGTRELEDGVANLKTFVDFLKSTQDAAMQSHLLYLKIFAAQYNIESNYNLVILPLMLSFSAIIPASKDDAVKYFGLKRNSKGIKYLKTVNIDIDNFPHTVANPFPIADIIRYAGERLGGLIGDEMTSILGIGGDMYNEKVYAADDHSWYVAGDNFSDQKVAVILRKKDSSSSTPLFTKLLGIQYPQMFAYSAASIYNAKGTMFPTQESDLIGPFDTAELEAISLGSFVIQALLFEAQLIKDDKTPYKIMSILIGAYLAVRTAYTLAKINEGKEQSPITRYSEAKKGGWGAHLAPYKTEEENN
jgi:hypothetical protein